MAEQPEDDDRRLGGEPIVDAYAAADWPPDPEREPPGRRVLSWALRFGVPALAALALIVVFAGDAQDIDHELQIVVPSRVEPGQLLPMRALLYTNLRGIEGPQLAQRRVEISLQAQAKTLARTTLTPARSGTGDMEGSLLIPQGFSGVATLQAKAVLERAVLVAEARVLVTSNVAGVPAEGRALRALQQLSEGPVRAEPGSLPPTPLHTRVAGGACVPEVTCTVLVHVGEPAAALQVATNAGVSASDKSQQPSQETAGVVALEITVHGPEAELWLRALRAGKLVAQRSVRLPIALASATLQVKPRSSLAAELPELTLAGGAGGCIVDAMRIDQRATGVWLRTGSLPDCARSSTLPFAPLGPGLYQLQTRRDPFVVTNTTSTRIVYVRTTGETDEQVLAALAERVRVLDAPDTFAEAVRREPGRFTGAAFDASFQYLAAVLEAGLFPQPRAATGYAQSLSELRATRARLRVLALCSLALSALALALSVGRRGLRASTRASEILVDAGQDAAENRLARLRGTFAVLASVMALVLVFVVIGLYVMARGFLH